ncbi:NrtR DNA-binding winged helix domain-containing protein [Eudoraea chungangensis]|uniref:NrtR DNA-binding winged helix domain-containing protein n=1 Tax=Eudoraea chungangensis TaxID=1481905 RepID=UPI0023EC6A0F|nr:NUDIX domain-containing protein [Eudoraea chungangensis]
MTQNSNAALFLEKKLLGSLPGLSIDCVIFGYKNHELFILLLQWKHDNMWSLPGGFIHKDEDMDKAAYRVLKERTGLDSIFLSQFHTFGNRDRIGKEHENSLKKRQLLLKELYKNQPKIIEWLNKRFITTGYFALVDINQTNPKPDFMTIQCAWQSIKSIPSTIMDHREIIEKALQQLRIQLNYLPVGLSLLPTKFTMQDLQKLYEAILQKKLERSNFQRKMLKLDVLVRHEKQMTGAANKAPYLYSFNQEKYDLLLKKGIGLSF